MEVFFIIILLLYIFLIVKYFFGWKKNKESDNNYTPSVSIVIAMRNEEKEVANLLLALKKQLYPTDKLEFILVNDHSTDTTLALLEQSNLTNLRVVSMPEGLFGKKNAIKKAVGIAKGEIVLATDADCTFTPLWTKTMVSYFSNSEVKMVSGPVAYNKKDSVFHSLQTLEFLSLIGSGAGAIGNKNAIFCNGANMAYRKEVFLEVNNFEDDKAASGDDVFLLHSIKAKYQNSIAFAKDSDAIVLTDAVSSLKGFVNQRKRWTAKSSGYKDIASIYTSFLVLFANLSLVVLFILSFVSLDYFQVFGLFYLLKFLVDLLLLYPVLTFFNRKDLVKWVFPFELLYSFYIVLIVVLSFTKSFEWKGRTHKK